MKGTGLTTTGRMLHVDAITRYFYALLFALIVSTHSFAEFDSPLFPEPPQMDYYGGWASPSGRTALPTENGTRFSGVDYETGSSRAKINANATAAIVTGISTIDANYSYQCTKDNQCTGRVQQILVDATGTARVTVNGNFKSSSTQFEMSNVEISNPGQMTGRSAFQTGSLKKAIEEDVLNYQLALQQRTRTLSRGNPGGGNINGSSGGGNYGGGGSGLGSGKGGNVSGVEEIPDEKVQYTLPGWRKMKRYRPNYNNQDLGAGSVEDYGVDSEFERREKPLPQNVTTYSKEDLDAPEKRTFIDEEAVETYLRNRIR